MRNALLVSQLTFLVFGAFLHSLPMLVTSTVLGFFYIIATALVGTK